MSNKTEPTLQEQLVEILEQADGFFDCPEYTTCTTCKAFQKETINTLTHLIEKAERKARIDELERYRQPALGGGKGGIILSYESVEDRIKELSDKGVDNE